MTDHDAAVPPMVPDAYVRADVAIGLSQRPGMSLELAVAAAIEAAYRAGAAAERERQEQGGK